MYVLGLKCVGHDTGAALITDRSGILEISAISEARLNRRKHSYTYPLLSIRYVLDHFKLESLDEVDLVCLDRHSEPWPEAISQVNWLDARHNKVNTYDYSARFTYPVEKSIRFRRGKVIGVNHIDAHAASAYHVSGFDDGAVLTIERGMGLYHGKGDLIDILYRTGYGADEYRDGKISFHSSRGPTPLHDNISHLYDLVSNKLGLDSFAAGKTMALAAFAEKVPRRDYLNIPADRNGGFLGDYWEIITRLGREIRQFKATSRQTRDLELLDEYWVNIAREAQEALESDVLSLVQETKKKTGSRNLCLAGGVALSCVTNRKILDLGLFDQVFVQPAASDEGIPLGCALWGYHQILKGKARATFHHAYMGTPNQKDKVEPLLRKWNLNFKPITAGEVAALLAGGKIIGRIAGASEYGPRALGNRSILADPRIANMLEVVNTQIKHRERFRPFAPSCLIEKQDEYFDLPCPSPFMLMACKVKPGIEKQIPAVIHVDSTSRVQSVARVQNASYYDLIQEFGKLTGVYVLLNTSFNDDGEPIVETYEDALLSFVRTGLHYLYIEDYLVERPDPATCERLKNELSGFSRARVEEDYRQQIETLCDPVIYRQTTDFLQQASFAYFCDRFLSLRRAGAFLGGYKSLRSVMFGSPSVNAFVNRLILRFGFRARQRPRTPQSCVAILVMILIHCVNRLTSKRSGDKK